MIKRFITIYFILTSFILEAGDSLKCARPKKFFIDLAGGFGGFAIGDPHDYLNPSGLKKEYNVSPINAQFLKLGYDLLKRDCKIREGVVHFLNIGLGISNYIYSVNRSISAYTDRGQTHYLYHSYSEKSFSYQITRLNTGIFMNAGALYPKGFCISNSLGVSYSTFINKKEIEYSEYITGTQLIYDPTVPGSYRSVDVNETRQVIENNYFADDLNLFYDLNVGYKIKNCMPFISGELNMIDDKNSTSTYCVKAGLRIML